MSESDLQFQYTRSHKKSVFGLVPSGISHRTKERGHYLLYLSHNFTILTIIIMIIIFVTNIIIFNITNNNNVIIELRIFI